jgi:hypothetical protein
LGIDAWALQAVRGTIGKFLSPFPSPRQARTADVLLFVTGVPIWLEGVAGSRETLVRTVTL